MENYESIDKALNISETDIVPTKKVSPPKDCLLYTSPSPRDDELSRMPSSA